MFRLIRYLTKKQVFFFLLLLAFLVVQVFADVTLPTYTARIVEQMQAGEEALSILRTGGIMLPWAVITAIRGDIPLALSLLAVYVVVTIIRNIIEPKIVGAQLGLHPVVTLVSMFVGTQLFGVLGLFGFPICLSLLRHLNDTGAVKIFK